MHMNILLGELLVRHAGQLRMSLDILVGDLSRFLHHVTEVSGH